MENQIVFVIRDRPDCASECSLVGFAIVTPKLALVVLITFSEWNRSVELQVIGNMGVEVIGICESASMREIRAVAKYA